MDLRASLRLYLVADPDQCRGDVLEQVAAAIRGGVTMVQLRAKHLRDNDLVALAASMGQLCKHNKVPFLINDRVDIALAVGAAGVHLGVEDLPLEAARSLGGPQFIIGFSPETDEQTRVAGPRGADYLGIGPVYGTTTKPDAGQALGLQALTQRIRLSELPVVGIGGITVQNSSEVLTAGADGIAVVSAILRADDAEKAARQLS